VLAILDTHRYQSSYCAWISFVVKRKKYIRIVAMDKKQWVIFIIIIIII
jgi:hypothetical protein